jgi:hypothetical protein
VYDLLTCARTKIENSSSQREASKVSARREAEKSFEQQQHKQNSHHHSPHPHPINRKHATMAHHMSIMVAPLQQTLHQDGV